MCDFNVDDSSNYACIFSTVQKFFGPHCGCCMHKWSRGIVLYLTVLNETSRAQDEFPNSKHKRLQPGKVSPLRPVPDHIKRPPYVNSRQAPGIASGPEVHNKEGIERMRASGKLAAQVLEFAGTLVKVHSNLMFAKLITSFLWFFDRPALLFI